MKYLGLFLLSFVAWSVAHVAAAAKNAVRAQRTGTTAGGVSLFPGLLILPMIFAGLAFALDRLRPNLGGMVVGSGHVLLLGSASISTVRSYLELRHSSERK